MIQHKAVNAINNTIEFKNGNAMIISVCAENTSHEIQNSTLTRRLQKKKKNLPQQNKAIHIKLIAIILLNEKNTKHSNKRNNKKA